MGAQVSVGELQVGMAQCNLMEDIPDLTARLD